MWGIRDAGLIEAGVGALKGRRKWLVFYRSTSQHIVATVRRHWRWFIHSVVSLPWKSKVISDAVTAFCEFRGWWGTVEPFRHICVWGSMKWRLFQSTAPPLSMWSSAIDIGSQQTDFSIRVNFPVLSLLKDDTIQFVHMDPHTHRRDQ